MTTKTEQQDLLADFIKLACKAMEDGASTMEISGALMLTNAIVVRQFSDNIASAAEEMGILAEFHH